jgi:hypothetical protein
MIVHHPCHGVQRSAAVLRVRRLEFSSIEPAELQVKEARQPRSAGSDPTGDSAPRSSARVARRSSASTGLTM